MRKILHANSSVPRIQAHDMEHFEKMYPGVAMENKYVLWLQFSFYWPYTQYGISARMVVTLADGTKLKMPKLMLRHLYPNKHWWYLCMKNGRKQSDIGIILPFDFFSDINSVKRIQCLWEISLDENSDNTYNALIEYKISLQEHLNKRHYSICSHDADIPTIIEEREKTTGVFGNTYNEYSKAFTIKSDTDGCCFFPVKGQAENLNASDIFKVLHETLDFESFFHSLISDNLFIVDYFMAEEVLIPHPCSWL